MESCGEWRVMGWEEEGGGVARVISFCFYLLLVGFSDFPLLNFFYFSFLFPVLFAPLVLPQTPFLSSTISLGFNKTNSAHTPTAIPIPTNKQRSPPSPAGEFGPLECTMKGA